MAFKLSSFAGVSLPSYNWTADLSTPPVVNPVVNTIGGAIDFYGSRRRIPLNGQEFELDADVLDDPATARTTIRQLKTLEGKYGALVRVHSDGTNSLQRNCRLLWAGFLPKATQRGVVNKLTMRFFSLEPFWRSASLTTHGPTAISSGSGIGVTIAGEEDVIDSVLTIAATSNIPTITVTHTKTENSITITSKFVKNTQLNSGTSWVVDTGLKTVTVGGAGALSSFALDSTHDEVFWLRFPAGSNTFTITLGGGGGNWTLQYYPAYQ